jgi:tetratricopeptide (TPR) repeat protein
MARISRCRRSEIQRRAQGIRVEGQRCGWPAERIAETIRQELPEVLALEAWRLAYGWSRPQALDGVATLYAVDGLRPPPINSAMLCRWEHGQIEPSGEYAAMLCRLYRARPDQLGLASHGVYSVLPTPDEDAWYGRSQGGLRVITVRLAQREGATSGAKEGAAYHPMTGNGNGELSALRESIQLTLEVEGLAGGSIVHEQLDGAVRYYALNYSKFPPGVLFGEVQRCRALVAGMLRQAQSLGPRRHLEQVAGWQSALLGNLAFHLADYSAALTHLGTAGQLGIHVGDQRLVAWTRGAQSMIARYQGRYPEALELAQDALRYAGTPLVRAQVLAWAELPALAGMQRGPEAVRILSQASDELEADPVGTAPGRFGFDAAEFELHAAEGYLTLGQAEEARTHAQASLDLCRTHTPGWAAATLTLARAEAKRARPDQAAEFSLLVLDQIPPEQLRETTRQRLAVLDASLAHIDQPGIRALHERLRMLPAPALPSE